MPMRIDAALKTGSGVGLSTSNCKLGLEGLGLRVHAFRCQVEVVR